MAASALDFVPMGTNAETLPASLTERHFRHFWKQTGKQGNERARLLHPPTRRLSPRCDATH
jgi:hypothetical protein